MPDIRTTNKSGVARTEPTRTQARAEPTGAAARAEAPPPAARAEPRRSAARTEPPRPAARTEPPRPAPRTEAPRAEAPHIDHSQSEHILITSDEAPDPRSVARTVRQQWRLANALRRVQTRVTLFEEGYLEVVERARGRKTQSFRLDLHYLDPIPSISRVIAKRAWWATAGCTAAALVAAALSWLGPVAVWCALGAAGAAAGAAVFAMQRSHEKVEFFTLHGRAQVLALTASFGAVKPLRALVPELCRAIEEAAEKITDDTSTFLRQEMREHYRLRGAGVLSREICAESTGRILAQFDVQI